MPCLGMGIDISLSQVGCYVAVVLTILLSSALIKCIPNDILGYVPMKKNSYWPHDAALNSDLTPKTMWMNMGFWKEDSDPPKACSKLLKEVLRTADLIDDEGYRTGRWPIKLVDLGFGFGNQTIEIMKSYPTMVSSYIGLTMDPVQYNFAHQRLVSLRILQDPSLTTDTQSNHPYQRKQAELDKHTNFRIDLLHQKLEEHAKELNGKEKNISLFCADAAHPATWTQELNEAIRPNLAKQMREKSQGLSFSELRKQETWILGLGTLYHFSLSRQPIFNHAYRKLQASIMAFDLMFGDETTMIERICIRIVALLMGCPMSNLLTATEYKNQLLNAGYDGSSVEISDISDSIFLGLADYLEKRNGELEGYLGMKIGPYKVSGWLLRWWARSGIVRGCIVVAKI